MRPLPTALRVGGVIVVGLVVVAVCSPLLAPYDPHDISGGSLEPPSLDHLLGTNAVGQDLLSQLVWGTRASLAVALPGAALAVAVGVLVGIGVALAGGVADIVGARAIDVLLAMPALPLLVLIVALAGPSALTVIFIIGLLGWPQVARIVRSQTLSLRQRDFVAFAQGLGGPWYTMRRHLVPAEAVIIVAMFVQYSAAAVFLESGLGFLGLSDPTVVSWGQVLNEALGHAGLFNTLRWTWWVVPPGLAIALTVFGLASLGVGIEPRLNPRVGRALA